MIKIKIKSPTKTLILNFAGTIDEARGFLEGKLMRYVGNGDVVKIVIYDHRERGRRKQYLVNFRGLTADQVIKKLC